MKRLLLVCALVGCGSSEPDPAPAVTSYPLCDAEHAWLARCPMADDCARAAIAACKQVTSSTSQAYVDTVASAFQTAPCDSFDEVQFTTPAAPIEVERTKVAQEFCDECRPGVADCVNEFYAGNDLGTGTASLILIMSDKNVHELNNRWPSGSDAGTCAATFQQIVVKLFTERVGLAHCP
jgi:hypothetical protein